MRTVTIALTCALVTSVVSVTTASGAPTCGGRAPTIVGTSQGDTLRGTGGADVISGLGGNDEIDGLGGNDIICGGRATDFIDGGAGNDRLLGDGGNDQLFGGQGDDHLLGGPGGANFYGGAGDDRFTGTAGLQDLVDYLFATQAVTVDLGTGIATGEGNDRMTAIDGARGSNFDDHISGDAAPNILGGGAGNDTLTGAGGGVLSGPSTTTTSFGKADLYYGNAGNDTFVGSDDFDVASWFDAPVPMTIDLAAGTAAGEGDDTMSGIDGVHSSRNGDTISGDGGDNAFALEGGNDVVDGRAGSDLIFIVSGNGATVDLHTGTAIGAGEDDALVSVENVWGTPSNDTLLGNEAANELRGRAGNDALVGRDGDDVLVGGRGRDSHDGGAGFDLCQQPPEGTFRDCENP
jgi:Ca2+-binding RTX toxin-like protein